MEIPHSVTTTHLCFLVFSFVFLGQTFGFSNVEQELRTNKIMNRKRRQRAILSCFWAVSLKPWNLNKDKPSLQHFTIPLCLFLSLLTFVMVAPPVAAVSSGLPPPSPAVVEQPMEKVLSTPSQLSFPNEFPYEFDSSTFSSPFTSPGDSTETEDETSDDEDGFLAGLTRRLALSTQRLPSPPSFVTDKADEVLLKASLFVSKCYLLINGRLKISHFLNLSSGETCEFAWVNSEWTRKSQWSVFASAFTSDISVSWRRLVESDIGCSWRSRQDQNGKFRCKPPKP